MKATTKLWQLEEYLGKIMQEKQAELDMKPLKQNEYNKAYESLLLCEELHLEVIRKVLPY